MKIKRPFISYVAIISVLIITLSLFACSPKKLSSNYGDNKTYADEDSVSVSKVKEKTTKMPFDTTTAPTRKLNTHYESY